MFVFRSTALVVWELPILAQELNDAEGNASVVNITASGQQHFESFRAAIRSDHSNTPPQSLVLPRMPSITFGQTTWE